MSRRRLTTLAAAALLATGLAGCGKVGALERPGPLLGARPAGQADAVAKPDPTRAMQTVDPRDRSNDDFPVTGSGEAPPPTDDAPATARPR